MYSIDGSLIFVQDEAQFIKAIDATKIETWVEFEFLLTVLIENRLLKLYQADLEN
jgi:hypothetical protein